MAQRGSPGYPPEYALRVQSSRKFNAQADNGNMNEGTKEFPDQREQTYYDGDYLNAILCPKVTHLHRYKQSTDLYNEQAYGQDARYGGFRSQQVGSYDESPKMHSLSQSQRHLDRSSQHFSPRVSVSAWADSSRQDHQQMEARSYHAQSPTRRSSPQQYHQTMGARPYHARSPSYLSPREQQQMPPYPAHYLASPNEGWQQDYRQIQGQRQYPGPPSVLEPSRQQVMKQPHHSASPRPPLPPPPPGPPPSKQYQNQMRAESARGVHPQAHHRDPPTGPRRGNLTRPAGIQKTKRTKKHQDGSIQIPRHKLICGWCWNKGHSLADCETKIDSSGYVRGCTLCNVPETDHMLDDCPHILDRSHPIQYWAGERRRGKAPLRTRFDLTTIAGFVSEKKYHPHTPAFALAQTYLYRNSYVYGPASKDDVRKDDPARAKWAAALENDPNAAPPVMLHPDFRPEVRQRPSEPRSFRHQYGGPEEDEMVQYVGASRSSHRVRSESHGHSGIRSSNDQGSAEGYARYQNEPSYDGDSRGYQTVNADEEVYRRTARERYTGSPSQGRVSGRMKSSQYRDTNAQNRDLKVFNSYDANNSVPMSRSERPVDERQYQERRR